MKKQALHKDFTMEIRRTPHRFGSIFLIVALGVAFFSGIRATEPDIGDGGAASGNDSRMSDGSVAGPDDRNKAGGCDSAEHRG